MLYSHTVKLPVPARVETRNIVIDIPTGYRIVAGRQGTYPKQGDTYMHVLDSGETMGPQKACNPDSCYAGYAVDRYIIVEPIPKLKCYTFVETGEVRQAVQGEWFINNVNGFFVRWDFTSSTVERVKILTREVTELTTT